MGNCKRLKQLLPKLDLNELGRDGIVIKTVDGNLVMVGPPPRGPLYDVYTFLEDTVGCRWRTSTESFLPEKPTLRIPALDIQYAPPLESREAFYRDAFQPVFAARLKLNGHHHRIPDQYGGHDHFCGFVHTFFPILPPSKYFAEHPEWYSEIHGKRVSERSQLCLTNDAIRRQFVANALKRLRNDPAARWLSVSQNDWHGRCQCKDCLAVEAEEGSPSGPLLRFVNLVAEQIEREFPDVLIETLAYLSVHASAAAARAAST